MADRGQLGFPPGAIRISTSQRIGHTVSRALKQKNVLRYWSSLDLKYKYVNGDSGRLRMPFRIPRGGKTVHISVMGR